MARAKNKSGGTSTVRIVLNQVHKYEGRAVEGIEEEGNFLIISKKPPRRSKFVKYRFPMSSVVAYELGEGGRNGAYAWVKATEDVIKPLSGDVELGEGYVAVTYTDKDGAERTLYLRTDSLPAGAEIIITEDSESSGAPKKKGKKPAKATKRRSRDEDEDEDEDDESEDEDGDDDESDDEGDEDDSDDGEDDEDEAPKKRASKPAKSSKTKPAKGKAKPAKGKAKPTKGRRTVGDW